ncbi:hypothetical protein TNCT_732431 [Trichonephila clavata]|uniref:Uncharacterized protein n=1 Tax=Trichonephila clavata TaxID=2740835 RepID=A0A8X6L9Z9_TRICU|nr:hypothetical protein TNCT_732431 [Trichonephila clavata]
MLQTEIANTLNRLETETACLKYARLAFFLCNPARNLNDLTTCLLRESSIVVNPTLWIDYLLAVMIFRCRACISNKVIYMPY